jgi:hypothetical protein
VRVLREAVNQGQRTLPCRRDYRASTIERERMGFDNDRKVKMPVELSATRTVCQRLMITLGFLGRIPKRNQETTKGVTRSEIRTPLKLGSDGE